MSANTLTNLGHTNLAQKILQAFVLKVTPILAFSCNISSEVSKRGDKVKVALVKAAAAAKTWTGSYERQGSEVEGLDVTIDQRIYTTIELSTEDLANKPALSMEMFIEQKAQALATAFLADLFGHFTIANFGAAILSTTAGNFDPNDVADLSAALDTAKWPARFRSLILAPTYHAAVVKDSSVQGTLGVENSMALRESVVKRLHGFDIYSAPDLSDGGENRKGLVVHPDALLVAARVLIPEGENLKKAQASGATFEVVVDPVTGLAMVMKDWYDPDTDSFVKVLELNYGRRIGNTEAAELIVTP